MQITLINAFLSVWSLIMAMGAAVNVDRVGRRPLFLASIAGMLACYATIMGLSAGFAKTGKNQVGTAV